MPGLIRHPGRLEKRMKIAKKGSATWPWIPAQGRDDGNEYFRLLPICVMLGLDRSMTQQVERANAKDTQAARSTNLPLKCIAVNLPPQAG